MMPDGMETASENIGDAGRQDFSRRADPARGSPSGRQGGMPISVRNAITRQYNQARQPDQPAVVKPTDVQPTAEMSSHYMAGAQDSRRAEPAPRSRQGKIYSQRHFRTKDSLDPAPAATPVPSPAASPAPNTSATSVTDGATSTAPPQSQRPDAKPSHESTAPHVPVKRPARLQFSKDETPPSGTPSSAAAKKVSGKARRSEVKLDAAKKNLPKKHRVKIGSTVDTSSGKPKRILRFETEGKSKQAHLRGPAVTRPIKMGANTAVAVGHRKLYEAEHENVGTKAAHRGVTLAEGGARTAYRLHKTAPYRKVERLESRSTKLKVREGYQKAVAENPKLKSNVISRMAQKRKIKRQYAKAARDTKKNAQRVKKTGDVVGTVGQAAVRTVARHPAVFGIICVILLIVLLFSSLISACSSMATSGGAVIAASSYLAEDTDIDNAELYYTDMEADLQLQIAGAERSHPGFDEYRYNIGDISHNPYELMAYLTTNYHDFSYADVVSVLESLFAEQYQLSFTESMETRYADPDDANGDGDLEPYPWHVLTVTLTANSFTDIVTGHMDSDQLQHFSILMQTNGGRQYIKNPLDFGWLYLISSRYGWQIDSATGTKYCNRGVDITLPSGTEIHAGQDGVVSTGYDAGGFGNYVVITDANGLVSKYARLGSVLVSDGQEVKAGDVIATSGSGGLHLEIIKNGQYLNPLYFADTGSSASPTYGIPGAPMSDDKFAAMIAEAEKYLGWPYVWGGSTPASSFDCSGFVCWVINHSGVGNVGRTTAQGLYNLCTPISPADARPGDLIFFTKTYPWQNAVISDTIPEGLLFTDGTVYLDGSTAPYTMRNDTHPEFYQHLQRHPDN